MIDEAHPHPRLSVHRTGAVLYVTLDNPQRRNAQTPTMWSALAEIAHTLPDDVRVVVLRGAGPSFSAGMDRGMLSPTGLDGEPDVVSLCLEHPDQADRYIARFQDAFTSWRSLDAVVVAAVQGHAVGAGFQLALGADLRIVADDVQFKMAETSLGLVPDLGGTSVLVELIGYPRALELCLTGRVLGAQESVEIGLATMAVPIAELEATTDDLVAALTAAPASSAKATKRLLAQAVRSPRESQFSAERQTQVKLIADLARLFSGQNR
ncbi:enoyl-CoA hydratase/isomerase family protein [Austwickia chelonae]|uniref:enoyl-CoA hydratase/isomerase family protein n=1 Tax=Austwickia chelonae TaxID=100225 RepID=UPI000E244D9E|nr:enoyl-CoA hydratase/isomerase family protein [Austwickia chelonae]